MNRRVDFLLNVLFRIEEDNFFNYKKKCQLPVTSNGESSRHQSAMKISTDKVKVGDKHKHTHINC